MKNIVVSVAALLVTAAGASASIGWDITIQTGESGQDWSVATLGQSTIVEGVDANGTPTLRVTGSHTGGSRFFAWDMTIASPVAGRGGPTFLFVNSNFTVENLTGGTVPFTINVTVPGSLAGPLSITGSSSGSVGAGLQSTSNGSTPADGATVSPNGALPLYRALIDGVGVRDLVSGSVSAPAFGTNPIGPVSFGFENTATPSVAANIGIRNTFRLTPGDNAQLTSTFAVVQIPTPAGIAAFGVMGLAGLRRRR
jgi:hypothetical protein